ncbi:MAG TPA: glycosyltransferase [Actinocrinis sp.]|nr:glycosyltransferase [Actinocrinis sp.]
MSAAADDGLLLTAAQVPAPAIASTVRGGPLRDQAPRGEPPRSLDLRHLLRMSDEAGLFEHADGAVPRRGHGYCVDDVARGLLVLCREPFPSADVIELSGRYLTFLAHAQAEDGSFHNRMGYDRQWHDQPGTGDWWGRAMWGLGTAAAGSPAAWIREAALTYFELGAPHRPVHLRSLAYAALGAAQVLTADPGHRAARSLLADTVRAIGPIRAGVGPQPWLWPEERLAYGNAMLPEVLLLAGRHLGDDRALADGLRLLGWLLEAESSAGHLSPTPVGGRGAADRRPWFDQQPIEVAALADACADAFSITADPRWSAGVALAAAWFTGENDTGAVMYDRLTGGGYDGLTRTGPNTNQGAESTLALLSTRQQDHRLRTEYP